MCLVPLADMFNTATQQSALNVACHTDPQPRAMHSVFRCNTTQPVAAGQELLAAYIADPPRRSNRKFVLDYGFLPDNNPWDSINVQVGIENILKSTRFTQKCAICGAASPRQT